MRVAVLGATGQAGRTVSRLLLQEAAIDVVACGRNDERLDALALALGRVSLRAASRILLWGLRQFASSSEGAALVLEGVALDGRRITLRVSHPDPYVLTGIPAVATVRQILAAPKPGVWTQSAFVEPRHFFQDVERLGASVTFAADAL